MAPLLHIPSVLAEFGLNAETIITEAGLAPSLFDDPENTIAFADLGRFLALCAERSGCAHFGHLVGESAGLEALGLVGELARQAPDVGAR